MERLKKAESLLTACEGALLVLLLAVMVLLSFSQVLLRQVFGIGLLWGDTFLRHAVLWVGFLGAALAAVDEKNFAFEALAERCGPRSKAAIGLAAHLTAVVVCALLAKAAWKFLLDEKASAALLFTAFGMNVPTWIFAVIVPAGFALIGLHTLVRAADCVSRLKE